MKNTSKHYATYKDSEFVCSLVSAITGVDIKEMETDASQMLAQNCVVFFIDYIVDYIQTNYSVKDAIRIKTVYETGDDLFVHFPDLKEKYSKAYNSFISFLETQSKLNGLGNGKSALDK